MVAVAVDLPVLIMAILSAHPAVVETVAAIVLIVPETVAVQAVVLAVAAAAAAVHHVVPVVVTGMVVMQVDVMQIQAEMALTELRARL